MKKNLFLVFIMVISLCLIVACGNNNDTSNKGANVGSNTSNGDNNAVVSDDANNTAITVSDATRGYNRNSVEAFVQINFKRGSAKGKLTKVGGVDAKTVGFSTTSDFNLLNISVFSNGLTIYFDGTEENYGNIQDIIYTKPLDPVLKDIDGTPVESFSYKLPYHNPD